MSGGGAGYCGAAVSAASDQRASETGGDAATGAGGGEAQGVVGAADDARFGLGVATPPAEEEADGAAGEGVASIDGQGSALGCSLLVLTALCGVTGAGGGGTTTKEGEAEEWAGSGVAGTTKQDVLSIVVLSATSCATAAGDASAIATSSSLAEARSLGFGADEAVTSGANGTSGEKSPIGAAGARGGVATGGLVSLLYDVPITKGPTTPENRREPTDTSKLHRYSVN
jgi:hypothetical protein